MAMTKKLKQKINSYNKGDCTIEDVFNSYKIERIQSSKHASDYDVDVFNSNNKFTIDYSVSSEANFDKFIKRTFSLDPKSPYMWLFWKSEVMDKIRFIAKNKETYDKIKNKFRFKYDAKPLNIIY